MQSARGLSREGDQRFWRLYVRESTRCERPLHQGRYHPPLVSRSPTSGADRIRLVFWKPCCVVPPMREIYVKLHKSTGLTLALLILLRIVWRLANRPPPLPAIMPSWARLTPA